MLESSKQQILTLSAGPDWAGYAGQHHGMPYVTGAHTPTSAASSGGPRPGQVRISLSH